MKNGGSNWPIIILVILLLIAIIILAPRLINGSTEQFKTFMDNL